MPLQVSNTAQLAQVVGKQRQIGDTWHELRETGEAESSSNDTKSQLRIEEYLLRKKLTELVGDKAQVTWAFNAAQLR